MMFSILSFAQNNAKPWGFISSGDGAEHEFKADGRSGFSMKLIRRKTGVRAAGIGVLNINQSMPSQNKLLFSCRGHNDETVVMTPLLSLRQNGKTATKFGPKFNISGNTWKNYVLALDGDFKLADALYDFRQLKFVANISSAPAGTEAGIEVGNVQIVSAEEADFTGVGEIIVYPPEKALSKPEPPLKVYFHLDNEDYNRNFRSRRQPVHIDHCQYGGFREMLLETVKDQAGIAAKPEEANVIVYSSNSPEPVMAGRIAEAVKKGIPLFAAADIADPEIAALLPVKVNTLALTGYPERKKLKPSQLKLNKASFGIYHRLENINGQSLLEFDDGSPAVIMGQAERGKVIYSCFTLGANLLPDSPAHDGFLLHAITGLTGSDLKPAVKNIPKMENGWQIGAGDENFGRFGFLIGDGLLCENISNALVVSNGLQEYSFSEHSLPRISLNSWQYREIGEESVSRAINWQYKWPWVGKLELTASCRIPAAWEGEEIQFLVEKGIDDLAEVYVNGTLIGKVTVDMPEYWQRPHRYRIAPELIRFGSENDIRIVSENLRGTGGFGSCPELTAAGRSAGPARLVYEKVDWLGKTGLLTGNNGEKRRFSTSMAFPGVRWDILSPKIDLSLHNIADYAAWSTTHGIRIADLRKIDEIPVDWNAPWLLLFKEGTERPLLLVLQKKLKNIEVKKNNGVVNGIVLNHDREIGMIVPLWPYGRENIESSSWRKGLPKTVMARINQWYPKAFKYPVWCREFFQIDTTAQKINIRSQFQYLETVNEWGVVSAPFAPVPPLAHHTSGMLFESADVVDWKLVTGYGNYAASVDVDTVNWSLPLPEPDFSQVPHVASFSEAEKQVNHIFKAANRWSAGGRTKFTDWTPQYPIGKNYPECRNVSMHAWNMGLNQALMGLSILDENNRRALSERIATRFYAPIERFQYKAANRWREEPGSGIRYSIYFNSFYSHETRYADGYGSRLNYGDQNETAHMIISMARQLADKYGQRDFVLANWKFLKQVSRLLLVSDDWGYMASGCRESGANATIDMLNCEYASMTQLSRLAEISGDRELQEQALYRAARRMVPTLARLDFKEYTLKHKLQPYLESLDTCVGFSETGPVFRRVRDLPKHIDLFDMSQGIPPDLTALYRKYPLSGMKKYLELMKNTMYKDGEFRFGYPQADILSQVAGLGKNEYERILNSLLRNAQMSKKLSGDWVGIKIVAHVAQVLRSIAGAPVIHTAKNLDIMNAIYDPASGVLEIELVADKDSILVLASESGKQFQIELKHGLQKIKHNFH